MMADQRRELEALRAEHVRENREWEEQTRFYLNRIEELERKLKAARDELADERAAHEATARALIAEHRRRH